MNDAAYHLLQKRLSQMEASHSRILNRIPGMAYRCAVEKNNKYRMVFASKGCKRLLGISSEDVMRAPTNTVEIMTVEEDLAAMRGAIRKALRYGRDYELYYRVRLPTDEIKWIWDQGEGVFDENGVCIFLEGIMMDVTAQKFTEIALKRENKQLRSSITQNRGLGRIIGASPAMRNVYGLMVKAAGCDANIILYGETGVGKDMAARTIHELSGVRGRYIPVNCAAIPEHLLESEFFGHVKGAFSGATANRPGYLAAANEGTLFLDEIAELPVHLQVKLLRALESKSYTPIGSDEERSSSFRLISATNRDILSQIGEGAMRADFFYRIHVLSIALPPLRERKEDIPLLAEEYARKRGIQIPVPGSLLCKYMEYDWPGNVRELQNALENYWAFGEAFPATTVRGKAFWGCIDLREVQEGTAITHTSAYAVTHNAPAHTTLVGTKEEVEKSRIFSALEQNGWKKGLTALSLGITMRTLQRKLKKYGIRRSGA